MIAILIAVIIVEFLGMLAISAVALKRQRENEFLRGELKDLLGDDDAEKMRD